MGRGMAERKVQDWGQSLARRQESETPLLKLETSPKKVWTVQNYSSHLPGGISVESPPILDDT